MAEGSYKKAVRVCAEVNRRDDLMKIYTILEVVSLLENYVSLHMQPKEKLDLKGFESFLFGLLRLQPPTHEQK